MTFAERLKNILGEMNMRQAELSRRTGLKESVISEYLHGKCVPKSKNLIKIAVALNVEPHQLSDEFKLNQGLLDSAPMYQSMNNSGAVTVTGNGNAVINGNNTGTVTTGETGTSTSYYNDPEVAELADRMKNQPGMRILFDAAKDVSKEDLETVAKMMEGLKRTRRQD